MPKGELQTNELVNDAFGRGMCLLLYTCYYCKCIYHTLHDSICMTTLKGKKKIHVYIGKSIFVPYIHHLSASSSVITPAPSPQLSTLQSSQMDMLSLASLEDYASLPRDNWGIPSIPSTSVPERENCLTSNSSKQGGMGDQVFKGLDLVILPGVAFGIDGRRLGHGKGYYDTWLSRCWDAVGADGEARMPILVGTALTEQLFEEGKVPVDGTDWLVDMVVTGDGRVIRKVEDEKEDDGWK